MSNPFVFIVGCPHSGTTLMERILYAHPQIALVSGSRGRGIVHVLDTREGLIPDGYVTAKLADRKALHGIMPQQELAELVHRLLRSGHPVSYSDLISAVSDRYAEARGKPFARYKIESTGHKTATSVGQAPMLHGLWPRAKFVHIIRDGRDLCLSVLSWRRASSLAERFPTWREEPVATAALWWEWQVRLLREAISHLGPGLYYEVRYEALVARPEEECAALCAFLGVPYDDAMLRFHEGRQKDSPELDAKRAWRPVTPGLRD